MPMTTTVTLAYEGAPACKDCQLEGIPVCGHVGFNANAWDHLLGGAAHVPGLDNGYTHVVRSIDISGDRKTVTLTVDTERPQFHDLARHLSTYLEVRAKAAVRAVHHETGETLEEGWYDRFLIEGMQVAIDRDLYHVRKVEHPNRNENGAAETVDLQVAHLAPIPVDIIQPVVTE